MLSHRLRPISIFPKFIGLVLYLHETAFDGEDYCFLAFGIIITMLGFVVTALHPQWTKLHYTLDCISFRCCNNISCFGILYGSTQLHPSYVLIKYLDLFHLVCISCTSYSLCDICRFLQFKSGSPHLDFDTKPLFFMGKFFTA